MGKKIKTFKTDLEYGQSCWVKNDMEGYEWILIAVITLDTGVMFRIKWMQEIMEVYDFEVTFDRDAIKTVEKEETDEDE